MGEGKELAEKHWSWLETLLHKVYVDAFEHGFKHGATDLPEHPILPDVETPSPPAETDTEKKMLAMLVPYVGEGGLNEGAADVLERLLSELHRYRVTPIPAEMPEVDPLSPPEVGGTDGRGQPFIIGKCLLWGRDTGGKKVDSCDGCKIAGCEAKGRTS